MKLRIWLAIALIVGCITRASAEEFEWNENKQPSENVTFRCTIKVTNDEPVRKNENLTLEVRLTATSIGAVYNPFFVETIPQPAVVALFDANRKYLGDALRINSHPPRTRMPNHAAWVTLRKGDFLGRELSLPMGEESQFRPHVLKLEPGKYYAQMIFHTRAATTPPDQRHLEEEELLPYFRHWQRPDQSPDIARSNVVEFEVVESTK